MPGLSMIQMFQYYVQDAPRHILQRSSLQCLLEIGNSLRIAFLYVVYREAQSHRTRAVVITRPSLTDGDYFGVPFELDQV